MYPGYITDVEGLKVGHSQSQEGVTGCTAILYTQGATGGVDVRGGAPGTRETDLFRAENMIDKVHAIVLSGGSAFGLEASTGVMKYLEEEGIGFNVGVARVPIVASAVIFDLAIGDSKIRPDSQMGYQAAKTASITENRQGNIGCGMGATVGKIMGPGNSMKSGLGSASIKLGELVVSAIVSVNSFGDIYNYKTGEQIAGVYDYDNKRLLNTIDIMTNYNANLGFSMENTTIGVIGTNAILTKAEANKVSQMAHNGFARSINPVHSMMDGDTIFTMATNMIKSDVNIIGTLAAEVMSQAITNAIIYAKSISGLNSYSDMD